jgi:hypothetical protein
LVDKAASLSLAAAETATRFNPSVHTSRPNRIILSTSFLSD